MLFPNSRAAEACKSYIVSTERHKQQGDISDWIALTSLGWEPFSSPQSQSTLPMLYAVTYPEGWQSTATTFWRLTGLGVSSRLAENCLERVETLRKMETIPRSLSRNDTEVYSILQSRIAGHIERAPVTDRPRKVAADDVYLYPSGMAAIYNVHQMLLRWRGAESAIMGFPYELTIKMLETYGPRYTLYSGGTDREIDLFEAHLEKLASNGQKLQAVWCECPSNPLLRTVDLDRIRRLATKYDFVVVVDDTIGSYANVDVLDIADIVITSLTKSFNGFADVLAGRQVSHHQTNTVTTPNKRQRNPQPQLRPPHHLPRPPLQPPVQHQPLPPRRPPTRAQQPRLPHPLLHPKRQRLPPRHPPLPFQSESHQRPHRNPPPQSLLVTPQLRAPHAAAHGRLHSGVWVPVHDGLCECGGRDGVSGPAGGPQGAVDWGACYVGAAVCADGVAEGEGVGGAVRVEGDDCEGFGGVGG